MEQAQRIETPVAKLLVYTGVWTNWSRGPVFGSTLTLTRDRGNLLIAFTAFFVAFVSTRFWRIICIALHRYYSTPNPTDGIHHQRQALLRNSPSPEWGFWTLSQLGWAWRKSTRRRSFIRLLPAALAAALCALTFAIASGFSSQISTGISDEVLIDGRNCGWFHPLSTLPPDKQNLSYPLISPQSKRFSNAINYAMQCYSDRSTTGEKCNTYVNPKLDTVTIDTEAPCPFKNGICRSNSSNIRIDSGYINSGDHLGHNVQEKDVFLYRQVLHCAPLRTEGYSRQHIGKNRNYTLYNYGERILRGAKPNNISESGLSTTNMTIMVPDLQFQYLMFNEGVTQRQYTGYTPILDHYMAMVWNGTLFGEGTFDPIDDLWQSDGDTTLVFLIQNGVRYLANTTDDWYRITVPQTMKYDEGSAAEPLTTIIKAWKPEEAASPLACLEQSQYCRGSRPDDRTCGPLASTYDAAQNSASLFEVTEAQANSGNEADPAPETSIGNIYTWLPFITWYAAATPGRFGNTDTSLGLSTLESRQTIRNGLQSQALPNDQWKLEVRSWFNSWLAAVQAAWVDAAIGVEHDTEVEDMVYRPRNHFDQETCNNQKIRSQDHTSFSMFGLCFTFATGTLIFIISYILEPLFSYFSRKKGGASQSKYAEWNSNDVLHLQCLGYHAQGKGTWTRFDDAVPITKDEESLQPLLFIGDAEKTLLLRNDSRKLEPLISHSTETTVCVDAGTQPSSPVSQNDEIVIEQTGNISDDTMQTTTVGRFQSQASTRGRNMMPETVQTRDPATRRIGDA
ncbi:hypothetical protein QBC38DRAFT_548978 [Podospora fimiseda]|uniref:Uncharacterized protein n=1 Tax=Podospora fimiseda TaxID=252190 RepID=A0AAN7BGS0_9PEZI|nr:hypothetical protein QBC38DRAFT_548978 [Podospora fimiseda]